MSEPKAAESSHLMENLRMQLVERSISKCKATACRAPIVWARWEHTGNMVPLDPDPIENGPAIVRIAYENGRMILLARPRRGEEAEPGEFLQMPHHATCLAVDEFRREAGR